MMKRENGICFLFYFILILLVAHASLGLQTLNLPIHFNSSLYDIYKNYGEGDQGSFARGGLAIFKNGWFDAKTKYLMSLWPPGFMLFEAVILKIFGANAPFIMILQALLAFCLAILFSLFRYTLNFFIPKLFALFIPLLLLIPLEFRFYLMVPDGVLFLVGDSFAITFVLIGLFCLYIAYSKNSKTLACLAGTAFALSAYFHSQFEMFFLVATINFLFIGMVYFFYTKIKKSSSLFLVTMGNFKILTPFSTILLALLMFHAETIPYRIYNYMQYHTLLWVQTSNQMMLNNFMTSAELEKKGDWFISSGGGNTTCVIAPKECAEIQKKIAEGLPPAKLRNKIVQIALLHPYAFIAMKLKLLTSFWFIHSYNYTNLMTVKSLCSAAWNNFSDLLFIGCFFFSFFWLFTSLRISHALISYWLSSSIALAYGLIFTFAHYETRYFIFFKIYFFNMAILGIAQLIAKSITCNKGLYEQNFI